MKSPILSTRKLNVHGFAHHFILPILAILTVAGIGTYLLGTDHAAVPESTITVTSDGNECLDNKRALKVAYNPVQIYTCNKGANQEWAVQGTATTAGAITNYNGYCLNVYNAGKTIGTPIDIYPCKNSPAQQWTVNSTTGAITNPNSKLCLSWTSPITATGTLLKLATCSTTATTDQWTVKGVGSSGTGSGGSGSTSTGFISASGMQLMQNGKQYKSIGFNFSAVGDCWSGTNWTTSQMDTFFAALPSDSLARFFAPPDGTDSASYVASLVHEADKYNIHLIIALADDDVDNNCDTEDAANNARTAAYYTDAPEAGSTYYNWVQSVVKPLANDPGVGMWEISNEPLHAGAGLWNGEVSQATFDTYVKNAAADIRAAEVAGAGSAKQLITIAPADLGDIGNASGAEGVFSSVDVVDDHDYSADADPGSPPVNTDFAQEEQVAKTLNKPFMVDEAGVEAGTTCNGSPYNAWDDGTGGISIPARVTFLVTDKATDYFQNGASSINYWLYTGNGGGCSYNNIYTGDPIMAAVKGYQFPS